MLGIKQDVAYFLVRNGLLIAFPDIVGRREAAMVNREPLMHFVPGISLQETWQSFTIPVRAACSHAWLK